jgi:hypothetical protein
MSGLSLAGVPLMQTTVMGFAPRSMDEVSSLLKSAYGPDFDLSERASSLSVVAEALNHGDLGRAMIAALQLKLPDLDWEAAANLARAEDRLLKYNEAEPRDWRGWWTTGGGVGPSKPLKPAPSGKPKRPSTASFSIPVGAMPKLSPVQALAAGEEVVGGGPEDPFADLAAGATLVVGFLASQMAANRRRPGGGSRSSSQGYVAPQHSEDDECEELNRKDLINCQIVKSIKGRQRAGVCRRVAAERFAECLRGGLSNVRTPFYWGN